MASLYVIDQGAVLRKHGEALVVEKGGQRLHKLECHRLDSVLLFGNVQITSQAIAGLLDRNIETSFLTVDGRLRGQLTPPYSKNVYLRIWQHDSLRRQEFVLSRAKEVVEAKVGNTLQVLKRAANHAKQPALREMCERLGQAAGSIREAENLGQLMGVEGSVASQYWKVFPLLLKRPENFQGRSRRPPRDPVNALLSLGYSLLAIRLQSLLDAEGFDPALGWLHAVDYGRPSLALDLLEPYRSPFVDRWVVKLFNLRVFTADDFSASADEGFRLTPEAMRRFFPEWKRHFDGERLLDLMRTQITSLRSLVHDEQHHIQHPRYRAR